ncbi:MAG: hypothetical protein GXP13_00720 [Gammaproteobacteria bacterium]|nr:hypothetical protein [Gammaproteobacteria bacterium]
MNKLARIVLLSFLFSLLAGCFNDNTPVAVGVSITSFTSASTSIPAGTSVNLTAVFVNGTGSIDNGVGAVTSGAAVSVTPAATTTYTLTVTDGSDTVTSTVTVTVTTASLTSFTSAAATIVAGSSVNLTAVFADGTGSVDNGVGAVTSGTAVSVTPAVTTTYTLTVTDGVTTLASTVTITVTAASITSFTSSAATITPGSSVNLTAVFANGAGSIDNGVGVVASGTSVSVTPAVTTTYTLTVTDGINALASTVTVTVTAASITSFTSSVATITPGSSVNLTAVFVNGTGSVDNGVGAVTSGTPVSVTPAATTTYTLSVTDGVNTVTATVTVTVLTASITSFTSSAATITAGSSVNLTAVFANGTGSVDNGVGAVASGTSVAVTPAATTTYTLSVTDGVNTVTSTVTVTVSTVSITSFISSAATIAAGSSANLTSVFTGGSGSIDNGVGAVTTGTPVLVSPTSTTTYTLTVDDGSGGTATSTATVTVLSLNTLSLSASALDQIFQASQLSYTSTVGFPVSSIQVIATTANAGATITVNGVALGGSNTSQVIALAEGANPAITIVVTAADLTTISYTLTITRQMATAFAQQAYVKASNTDAGDQFGQFDDSVALSGDTMVVGARFEDSASTVINSNQADNTASNAGAVYVFTRSGTTWIQEAYIKASNAAANHQFGRSVTIEGDTLVVGATGETSNATVINGNQADNSLTNAGAVYVFTRTGTVWTQQAYIKASNTNDSDFFGRSVSLSGNTLAVSAPSEDSNGTQSDNSVSNSGAVYVFTRSGTTWSQEAYIKASNPDAEDVFGRNLQLDGDTLAVTAPREDSAAIGVNNNQADNSAVDSGAVYVFSRSGTTWSQEAYIKASNTETNDIFGGIGMALSGNTLAVGARFESSNATVINGIQTNNLAVSSGAVYVFTRNITSWSQQAYIKASNADAGDLFGNRLALDGDTLAVSALFEASNDTGVNGTKTNNSAASAGAVYLFTRSGTTWSELAYVKASNTDAGDLFGSGLALENGTLAVSSARESSNAIGVNSSSQADNSASFAGAVYVFQ